MRDGYVVLRQFIDADTIRDAQLACKAIVAQVCRVFVGVKINLQLAARVGAGIRRRVHGAGRR